MRKPIHSGDRSHPSGGNAARQFALALALPFFIVGCGDEGPARQPVSGTITLDGKPLAAGTVTFAPLDGPTAATVEVQDGAYRVGRSDGPAPGRYQVEINAVQPTGKRIKHPDLPSETIDEVRNIIPPKYNVRTELTVEVKADGENAFPFELSSRKPARKVDRRLASRGTRR